MALKIANWLDERIGWRSIWETVFKRNIPRVNWFYTLGSATLLTVVNQGITGMLLTIYYVPTPDHAYDSVQYITTQVSMGWLIRGLHHWGASAMVILSFLHMLRVIFLGSYKFPREVTWITGVGLFLVTIGFGFTGYLLPWDQKAYWATTVGTRILEVTPLIGDTLLRLVRGGAELSPLTLTRFFGIHVWFLPITLIVLLGIHLYLVISIGISEMPQKEE
jgi:quinol-cytochrome oxidoreductase complex cytochrome b subunit